MSRDVVMIPEGMGLRAAARLLLQAQISGAPVVDTEGRCVGVLSVTDIARFVERGGRPDGLYCRMSLPAYSAWQLADLLQVPTDHVRYYMASAPVTVGPGLPIREVVRRMLAAHIHRVIVTDEERRPIGIVASTDILAAVADAETPETHVSSPSP